jgi:hypothetical protein
MNKIEQGIYDNSVDLDTIKDGGSLQGLSSASEPTFAKLTLTTSTYGSQSIGALSYWVIPTGIYTLSVTQGDIVQVWTGSSWIEDFDGTGYNSVGTIISDGSNIRIRSNVNYTRTIHYRKFS